MKEIKFRAWDRKEKMMYWNVQNTYDMTFCHNLPDTCADLPMAEKEKCDHAFIPSSFRDVLESKSYIVMQYIGLKDKDGREIYEDDLVKFDDGSIFKVEIDFFDNHDYEDSWTGIGWNVNMQDVRNCQIIGNIHDGEKEIGGKK